MNYFIEQIQNVIHRDIFIKLGHEACLLYLYLFFNSRMGICNCPKSIIKMIDVKNDDYQLLIENGFIEELNNGNVKILDFAHMVE